MSEHSQRQPSRSGSVAKGTGRPRPPSRRLAQELCDIVVDFVNLGPAINIERTRRFVQTLRTGDREIDQAVRSSADLAILGGMMRGRSLASPHTACPTSGGRQRQTDDAD